MNTTSVAGLETTPAGQELETGQSPDLDEIPPQPETCSKCSSDSFEIFWKLKNPRSPPGESKYGFAGFRCTECEQIHEDRRESFPDPPSRRRVPSWQEVFGHPQPYDHQEEAIEELIETGRDGGFMIMEGGCGTGKTMIALTGGLSLIRDPDTKFEQLFILTSVKQQLGQFEDDLRIINRNLPEDVPEATGVTLVGKGDLCPYAREEKAGFTQQNVNRNCQRLRNNTSQVMSDRNISGERLASLSARQGSDNWGSSGSVSPYPPEIPSEGRDYCPYYAKYQGYGDPTFRFDHAKDSILNAEEMVRLGVEQGMCPHSSMSSFATDAEVVMGNYYHGFDHNTLQITGNLIDESTLIICDEAHMLEPRVRSILSRDVSMYEIQAAANEVARVVASFAPDAVDDDRNIERLPQPEIVHTELAKNDIAEPILEDVLTFLDNFQIAIETTVNGYLNEDHPNWESNLASLPSNMEIPLREPRVPEADLITQWVEQTGVPDHVWEKAPDVGEAVAEILDETDDQSDNRSITDVAELIEAWFERDHVRHFRELTLEVDPSNHYASDEWQSRYTVSAEFHNVFPRQVLGTRLTDFGAGLLMSATIAPMDAYTELTGLDYFQDTGGTITKSRYDPSFPAENNLSLTLDLPKFTYTNRGAPGSNSDLRNQYARAILSVVTTTPGNVLVCLPSYREAKWGAQLLSNHPEVSKPILVDESSSEKETKRLKQEFFDGPPKVITTSLKGTLTEGVDYKGDRLAGCIVCGVPIDNVESAKVQAIHQAYMDRYGNYQKGFEYGLTLPAVRKARQALGRVIRSTEDVGVRVLVDHRYAVGEDEGGYRQYLSPSEQENYRVIDSVDELTTRLGNFWK